MAREYIGFPTADQRDELASAIDKAMAAVLAARRGPNGEQSTTTWCACYDDLTLPANRRYVLRIDDVEVPKVLGQQVTIKNRGGQDKVVVISLAGSQRNVTPSDNREVKPPRGGLEAVQIATEKSR